MALDSGDGEKELGESLDASKSELVEAFSSWGETSGEQQEDLELDFSGCIWSSPLDEIPTWTESFKETVSEFDNDIVCPIPLFVLNKFIISLSIISGFPESKIV